MFRSFVYMIATQEIQAKKSNKRASIYIPKPIQKRMLACPDLKYRCIINLLLRTGARSIELVRIQYKDFDFESGHIRIYSVKKREAYAKTKKCERKIPMTLELQKVLKEYLLTLPNRENESYIFPPIQKASSSRPHLTQRALTKFLKKRYNITAHDCRKTFATDVIKEEGNVLKAQKLLGHGSYKTTEIYLEYEQHELDKAVLAIEEKSLKQRFLEKITKRKEVVNWYEFDNSPLNQCHIGRTKEMSDLHGFMNKKVNVLLQGEHGTGKTHILDNLKDNGKFLRIDSLGSAKTVMKELVKTLSAEKVIETEKDQIFGELLEAVKGQKERQDFVGKIIDKQSIKNLCDLSVRLTEPQEYFIIIDKLDGLGKYGRQVLEELKNHFVIIAACRQLKVENQHAVSNFQKIKLENLNRAEAIKLVEKLSWEFLSRIQDYDLYLNHIFEQTQGNPLLIYEIVARYKKEGWISRNVVRSVDQSTGVTKVAILPYLMLVLASFTAFRYIGKGMNVDKNFLYLLAGCGMIALYLFRDVAKNQKKKYV